jgi:hypothetical protein
LYNTNLATGRNASKLVHAPNVQLRHLSALLLELRSVALLRRFFLHSTVLLLVLDRLLASLLVFLRLAALSGDGDSAG